MNIALFGADFQLGQLPRIREALIALGHTVTYENPDLIYSNDAGGFQEAIALKGDYPSAKLILNILDIPSFLPEFKNILEKLKWQTAFADKITCISESVREDIRRFLHIDAACIYNPIMDVSHIEGTTKTLPFLYVGRANAINKRFSLLPQVLSELKMPPQSLVTCGSENPNFGYYASIVDNETLNLLYNSSRYVFLPSSFEGIGLPIIEALVCKSIPIVCSDNPTSYEFAPPECIFAPNAVEIANGIRKIEANYREYVESFYENYGKKYLTQFSKERVAQNILSICDSL